MPFGFEAECNLINLLSLGRVEERCSVELGLQTAHMVDLGLLYMEPFTTKALVSRTVDLSPGLAT